MVTAKLCFRLLPIQILLAVIGAFNGIVTSLFASNFIGQDAMSAVGLFAPISMFIGAVSTMLLGGSQILSAEYKGKNQVTRTQEVFSLDMVLSFAFSVFVAVLLAAAGAFNWTGMFTNDPAVRVFFNQYLIGMSLGILPQVLGQQLSGFLSLENQTRLTLAASTVYILVNPVFNYIFIMKLGMQALGLALASVLGLWVFLIIQAQYFFNEAGKLSFPAEGLPDKRLLVYRQDRCPRSINLWISDNTRVLGQRADHVLRWSGRTFRLYGMQHLPEFVLGCSQRHGRGIKNAVQRGTG